MIKTPDEIKRMFDDISKNYDFLNNIISFFTHKYIKKEAVKLLKINDRANVLDLCCGSGDVSSIIKKNYFKTEVIGVDFSKNMLQIAKAKYPDIDFIEADALNLPFSDNSFDFITISFGLRNIPDKTRAIEEISRVLKPKGKVLHLDFGNKNFISKIYNFLIMFFINFIKNQNAYKYLIKSKTNFLTPDELIKTFETEGFKLNKKKYFLFNTICAEVFELFDDVAI